MRSTVQIRSVNGPAIAPWMTALASLRIAVFREWPYLYAGTAAFEAKYLEAYARSPRSLFVLALDGDRVVGCSTGVPLADETGNFQQPWAETGQPPSNVFYFGESVLLPAYRGQGLGHRFFDAREHYARQLGGFVRTAFCAVDRAPDDPRRPAEARPLDAFWLARGYQRHAGMQVHLPWAEIDSGGVEIPHTLTFWSRAL